MRIFENREDEAFQLSREDQTPLAKKEPRIALPLNEPLTSAQKEALPLDTFPLIEDFEVILLPWPSWGPSWRRNSWGYHFGFFSQQQGLLACFGLWGGTILDYAQENAYTLLDFWDRDQSWEQIIFERGEYVYVLEGDFDNDASGYHCWFRVSKARYLAEWQLALEACRRVIRQKEERA